MISVMLYSSRESEREQVLRAIRRVAALVTEESWEFHSFGEQEQLEQFFQEAPLVSLAGYDVSQKGSIEYLEQIRRRYAETLLFLIADPSMSPMEYIRPTILASSLLIRPLSEDRLHETFRELVEAFLESSKKSSEEMFMVETRDGRTAVPLSKVYYFEAREKKIYIRLRKQEITLYETIEHLVQQLPEAFVRCHRSFIVNRERIFRVMLSKNLIELEHGIQVPLSRSYKPVFKEME